MERPDDATMAWAESAIGPFQILFRFAHSHGYSQLWRLDANGRHVWLKRHAHPHKWAGEVHALSRWSASLDRVPALLAFQAQPAAVLIGEVPGQDAGEVSYAPGPEARLWREAGEWLRRLHQKENDWFGNVAFDGSPHGTPSLDAMAS